MSGIGHGGGALQRHAVSPPAGREHRRDLLHRQRGSVRHLLPNPEVDHAHLRRLEPPGLGHHVRRHHLLALPRSIERRFKKVGREYGLLIFISINIQLTNPNSLNTQSTPMISIPNDNNILSPLTT